METVEAPVETPAEASVEAPAEFLSAAKSFRQLCDKPSSSKIAHACWSPQRDLIAVITNNKDVRLHRMYWQKVWSLPSKEAEATTLAWRPDGKVLAVGYMNGEVRLVEVEQSEPISTLDLNRPIASLRWSHLHDSTSEGSFYEDKHKEFIPEVKDIESKLKETELLIPDKNCHTVLIVGTSDGSLSLFVDGLFEISLPKVAINNIQSSSILDSHYSNTNGQLSVLSSTIRDPANPKVQDISIHQYHSSVLESRRSEISFLSLKFAHASLLMKQIDSTMEEMATASEDIHLKTNSKLEKLEKMLPSDDVTVSSEFTMAYATGISSAELESFLTQDLTSKGLKQVAQSVNASYSGIQKHVKDELESISQALLYHSTELLGMSKWEERFGVVGLQHSAIKGYIDSLYQFILKVQELLRVVINDIRNISIFFTWLTCLVQRVSNETETYVLKQFDNDSYEIMLDFLEHRLAKDPEGNGYHLEHVSQFFKEGCLRQNVTGQDNVWTKYVKENEILKSCPLIVLPEPDLTMSEIFKRMGEKFTGMFDRPHNVIADSVVPVLNCKLYCTRDDHEDECQIRASQCFLDCGDLLLALLPCTCDSDKMYLLRISKERQDVVYLYGLVAGRSGLNESSTSDYCHTIRDAVFYNKDTLTVLIEEEYLPNESVSTIIGELALCEVLRSDFLVTCNVSTSDGILDQEHSHMNWFPMLDKFSRQRKMDSFRAKSISVSGPVRETACVISSSGRRIVVFDMKNDEDEDEDEDSSKLDDDSRTTNDQEPQVTDKSRRSCRSSRGSARNSSDGSLNGTNTIDLSFLS